MSVVFAKTPRGHAEMERRSGALAPRVRRVLIFVDGKRSVDDMRALLQSDDLQHTLGMLEEEGYIEVVQADVPAAPLYAFRDLPELPDPTQLQMARNFMTNTLNAFVGSLGASSLIDRIEHAPGHPELRGLYDEWYHAMVMSREGRREAEALRTKLLSVI